MKWFVKQVALGMLWMVKRTIVGFITNWPVIFRANIYFWGAFIVAMSEKVCAILFNDVWPSWPYACGSLLAALGVALIALRAFYDGAAQRHADQHAGDAAQTTTRTEIQQTVIQQAPPAAPVDAPKI